MENSAISATGFVLKQAVTSAVPLLLAGLGETVAQRSGVINVGIEGMMLVGCIAAFAGAMATGSALAGVAIAAGAAMVFAGIFALVTIGFRADQVVTGTALNLLAFGATTMMWTVVQKWMAAGKVAPTLFERVRVARLADWPVVGGMFDQYGLCYVTVALAVVVWVLLRLTRLGLIVQALGDAPEACDAAGIRVRRWRTGCVLFAGACAGVAGSYLSIMRGHSFQVGMTGGQGFLVLALVIFGRWNVWGLLLGTLMFGAVDGLQVYLAGYAGAAQAVPHQLFEMLPYVATLVALGVLARTKAGPACLGKAWPE